MAKGPSLVMKKKMFFVLAVICVLGFLTLIGRLIKLQIIDGNFYEKLAVEQQLSDTPLTPKRGTIYDRNMKPLAESATVFTIYAYPSYIKDDKKRQEIADSFAKILGTDSSKILSLISQKTKSVVIARKVEKPQADLIRQYKKDHNLNCVDLIEDSKRYYPFGNFAANVLGFTGLDNQGLDGIEAYYDKYLKGVPGRVVTAKNAKGTDMPYKYQQSIAAQDGTNLVLTIDEVVQHYLEKHLQDALVENKVANKVTGIVMDVNTGEILAMASKPDFDPNTPFTVLDTGYINGLYDTEKAQAEKNPKAYFWRNKAICDPYEPGSCFKIVTAASALEEKVVKESDTFYCKGSLQVANRNIGCWKHGGHGSETFLKGIENSCNPVFMTIAARLGAANFFKYFNAFGLTKKTNIDLPGEAEGIYHSEKDLGPVQLAVSSFGQTFKITPIQLITAVSAVANGGNLVQPHLVKRMVDSNNNIVQTFDTQIKRQVISKETSQELSSMLEKVVSEGTGKNAYVKGYRIAGKTGTSQKMDVDGGQSLRISSFMGFAPADNPKVAVLVIMDEPHASNNFGGVIAAPIVGSIMSDILPYLGVEPQYNEKELAELDVKTPGLTGRKVTDITQLLNSHGLKSRKIGNGDTITSQIPAEGQSIPRGGTVIIYTGNEKVEKTVTVPDLSGLTANQVNQRLAESGLNIKLVGADLKGTGVKAYAQSPAKDAKVPPGTVVTVQFRNVEDKVE